MEINEKLDIFFRAAIATAEEQSGELLENDKRAYLEELEDYEKTKQDGQQTRERVAEEKVKKEVNRAISEQIVALKKEYHKAQEERKEELFSIVERKLSDYRKTDDYRRFLEEKIKEALVFAKGAEMILYIDPADSELKESLEQETGCVITVSREIFGGGIRAVIRSKNVLIDESFAGRLKVEKESYSF